MKTFYIFTILVFCFISVSVNAEIIGKEVEYKSQGTNLKGYLAYDNSIKVKRPGVIVVHEWWGHNDYARSRTNKLAKMGYTALAVDMYGDAKTANHPDKAGELAGSVLGNLDLAQNRFEAGINFLKEQNTVNPNEIAAIGYCFGGAVVLNMALRGVDLDGVASFHGILPQKAPENPNPKAEILIFHGGDDPFVPQEQLDIFKIIMENTKSSYELVVFPGVKHSFTVPNASEKGKVFNLPLEYNEDADKKSWELTQAFLKRIFQPENN